MPFSFYCTFKTLPPSYTQLSSLRGMGKSQNVFSISSHIFNIANCINGLKRRWTLIFFEDGIKLILPFKL